MSSTPTAITVNKLRLRPDYIAGERFMTTIGWREERPGQHILAPAFNGKDVLRKGKATITILGRIAVEGTYISPDGNYSVATNGYQKGTDDRKSEPKLLDAKFVLIVRPPVEDTDAIAEWELSVKRLGLLADTVTNGEDYQHLFKFNAGEDKSLRITQKMWATRTTPVDEISGTDETMNWPIGADFKEKLSNISRSSCIMPLVVWKNDRGIYTAVEPEDVQTTVIGSLCEITFGMKHYAFRRNGVPVSHTVVADIEQIIVHRPALAEETSPFRKSRRIRPYIPIVPMVSFDDLSRGDGEPTRGETLNAAAMFYGPKASTSGNNSNKLLADEKKASEEKNLSESLIAKGTKRVRDDEDPKNTSEEKISQPETPPARGTKRVRDDEDQIDDYRQETPETPTPKANGRNSKKSKMN